MEEALVQNIALIPTETFPDLEDPTAPPVIGYRQYRSQTDFKEDRARWYAKCGDCVMFYVLCFFPYPFFALCVRWKNPFLRQLQHAHFHYCKMSCWVPAKTIDLALLQFKQRWWQYLLFAILTNSIGIPSYFGRFDISYYLITAVSLIFNVIQFLYIVVPKVVNMYALAWRDHDPQLYEPWNCQYWHSCPCCHRPEVPMGYDPSLYPSPSLCTTFFDNFMYLCCSFISPWSWCTDDDYIRAPYYSDRDDLYDRWDMTNKEHECNHHRYTKTKD
jgi:hypothetical protein